MEEKYNDMPSKEEIFSKNSDLLDTEKNAVDGCQLCDAGYLEDGIMCNCLKWKIRLNKYSKANVDYDYASLEIYEEEVKAYLKDDNHPDGKFRIKLNPFIEDYIANHKNYRNDGVGIIFAGPVGRGKSLSAMKVLMNLIDKGYTGYFATISEVFEIIKKSWNDDDYAKLLRHIYDCDFLVVDDLGTEYHKNDSDWAPTEIDKLMRHRYYKKKPLIITTNSGLKKLTEKYAQRIVSLFHERSLITTIVSEGDYREKLNKTPKYMNKNKFAYDESDGEINE